MARLEAVLCKWLLVITFFICVATHARSQSTVGSEASQLNDSSSPPPSAVGQAPPPPPAGQGAMEVKVSPPPPTLEPPVLDARSIMTTNYASSYLGAKIVEQHKEAKGASNLLRESKESYLNIPCRSEKKFFTVQLSREIEVNLISISNLEFFSSFVKNFTLVGSRVFPCHPPKCMWRVLGNFQGKPVRQAQLFPIPRHPSVRFLRFLWVSQHGREKSCTMTTLQVYGTDALESFAADFGVGSGAGHAIGRGAHIGAGGAFAAAGFKDSSTFDFESLSALFNFEGTSGGEDLTPVDLPFVPLNFTQLWSRTSAAHEELVANATRVNIAELATAAACRSALASTKAKCHGGAMRTAIHWFEWVSRSPLSGGDPMCTQAMDVSTLCVARTVPIPPPLPRIAATSAKPQIRDILALLPANATVKLRNATSASSAAPTSLLRRYEQTSLEANRLAHYIRSWQRNASAALAGSAAAMSQLVCPQEERGFAAYQRKALATAVCPVEWGYVVRTFVSAKNATAKAAGNANAAGSAASAGSSNGNPNGNRPATALHPSDSTAAAYYNAVYRLFKEVKHLHGTADLLRDHNTNASAHMQQLYADLRAINATHEAALHSSRDSWEELSRNLYTAVKQLSLELDKTRKSSEGQQVILIVWCCVSTAFSLVAMLCVALRPSYSSGGGGRGDGGGGRAPPKNSPASSSSDVGTNNNGGGGEGMPSLGEGAGGGGSDAGDKAAFSHSLLSPITPEDYQQQQPIGGMNSESDGAALYSTSTHGDEQQQHNHHESPPCDNPAVHVLSDGSTSEGDADIPEGTVVYEGEGGGGSGHSLSMSNGGTEDLNVRMLGEMTDDTRASARDLTDLLETSSRNY